MKYDFGESHDIVMHVVYYLFSHKSAYEIEFITESTIKLIYFISCLINNIYIYI